ncbi:hypothetical protein M1146_01695 [Patescibacteria group bacterium]|nr:hypothetical protein [Patescibacteria group bacterium]
MKIARIKAGKVLASLGSETIEVQIELQTGTVQEAMVPAGISAGKYEVKKVSADEAISQIQQIENLLLENDWTQETLDEKLNTLNLGGNTSLAISVAFWKATSRIDSAKANNFKFPKLMLLLFEGGKHGNSAISMQEFMIIEESLKEAIEDFKLLRKYLEDREIETTVGAEGGFSPMKLSDSSVLQTIKEVFPKKDIAIDAAGSFRESKIINYDLLISRYRIASLEDPFSDEDWHLWIDFCSKFGNKIMIVGDDLTTTNPTRLTKAIEIKAINAVIIKPNQNGTISGAMEAVKIARKGGLKIIVSHRGEETIDDWIVDFALKAGADFVKFGGIDRGERIAKYNRLSELGMA